MRTKIDEKARYTYLKTTAVAKELDCGRDHVVSMIQAGKFPDLPDGTEGVIDIGTGSRPEWRIHPESFAMFKRGERAAAA